MEEAGNELAFRRRMTGRVIAGLYHVALGPVFWERFEALNERRHYRLTCEIDRAHLFDGGW